MSPANVRSQGHLEKNPKLLQKNEGEIVGFPKLLQKNEGEIVGFYILRWEQSQNVNKRERENHRLKSDCWEGLC